MSRGKAFEAEVKRSLEAVGCLAHRIKDTVIWNGHAMVGQETPADIYCVSNVSGKLSASLIECKAVNGKSLPFDRIKQHQLDSLLDFDSYDEDCHGFIAIDFYNKDDVRHFNVCQMVPVSVWREHMDGERKSLPFSFCEEDPRVITCPRVSGGMFDMGEWTMSI